MKKIFLIVSILSVTLLTSIPIFAQNQHGSESITAESNQGEKKIKYWTCGMHPQIKQDQPGMCPICNMKLIPVYEQVDSKSADLSEEKAIINIDRGELLLAGVKSVPVIKRHLFKDIRTVGRVAYDPELYKAEEELIQALKTKEDLERSQSPHTKERAEALVDAAGLKLRLLGLSAEQIAGFDQKSQPDRSLIISDKLNPYVWVYADIYEYELSWIKKGQPVKVVSISFPGEEFNGEITAIDPVLNPKTRTARIRVKIDNPEIKLKPQMYVDIYIEAYLIDDGNQDQFTLALPKDAVLDTGVRKIVYVDLGGGSYSGREVQLGPEASSYLDAQKFNFYPVIGGLAEGDLVVTKANFLIDSQSQISGVAASAYGGALEVEDREAAPVHQH